MPGPEHFNVPLMGRPVERPLLADDGGAFVLADVFLVRLASPRALGETAIRHRRIVFHDGFLRLLFGCCPSEICFCSVRVGATMEGCLSWFGNNGAIDTSGVGGVQPVLA